MEWYQLFTIVAFNLGMYFHNNRQIHEFHKENKDFHGRLCRLEERYINMMEKAIQEKR